MAGGAVVRATTYKNSRVSVRRKANWILGAGASGAVRGVVALKYRHTEPTDDSVSGFQISRKPAFAIGSLIITW